MRITIVIGPFYPIPPVLGGAVEKVHLLLAGAYRAGGHDVTMISRRYKDLAADEVVEGIRHIRIRSTDRSSSLAVNLALDLCYAVRVACALPPADVTITNAFFLPLVLPHRRAGKIYVQVGRYPKGQMWLYFRADRLQAVSRAVGQAIARQVPWLKRKIAVIPYAISDRYFSQAADSRARAGRALCRPDRPREGNRAVDSRVCAHAASMAMRRRRRAGACASLGPMRLPRAATASNISRSYGRSRNSSASDANFWARSSIRMR